MKNTIRQLFHSPRFVIGFGIFVLLLLTIIIYPLFNPGSPLEQIGVGTFARPGTYVSLYDSMSAPTQTFRIPDAEEKRMAGSLSDEDRVAMVEWFTGAGVDMTGVDVTDTDAMLELWFANYDSTVKISGMTQARRNYFQRLNNNLLAVTDGADYALATENSETGEMEITRSIGKEEYVNVGEVINTKTLPLGTDNFGADVLKKLVSACGTSIRIGLLAGVVATLIGLTLGLLSGYLGGIVDDIIMFITNIFTVIPGFILLILITNSVGQEHRGATLVSVVIGLTSWTWTTRSVRSQVISLRNRDHVNLSKLSGHSMVRIVLTDILPYIASYVVMAFILQVSSGILSEAQLSMLGLGPSTATTTTLGLMMNWAVQFSAHTNGSWWAYFPVILTITLISFSLNLMNTGMDQVFNPTLRD